MWGPYLDGASRGYERFTPDNGGTKSMVAKLWVQKFGYYVVILFAGARNAENSDNQKFTAKMNAIDLHGADT
ncbi:MAG: hypothetical protein O2916_09110 [Proteobacteria bacterium]|nr:hypothetical protein [Pseudomonadota bacterium]